MPMLTWWSWRVSESKVAVAVLPTPGVPVMRILGSLRSSGEVGIGCLYVYSSVHCSIDCEIEGMGKGVQVLNVSIDIVGS